MYNLFFVLFNEFLCLRRKSIFAPEVSLFICKPCRYDPQTNQWSAEVAPTSSCRTSVGVAVLDGYLYAVGGQDGVSCLNHVERYETFYIFFLILPLIAFQYSIVAGMTPKKTNGPK